MAIIGLAEARHEPFFHDLGSHRPQEGLSGATFGAEADFEVRLLPPKPREHIEKLREIFDKKSFCFFILFLTEIFCRKHPNVSGRMILSERAETGPKRLEHVEQLREHIEKLRENLFQ